MAYLTDARIPSSCSPLGFNAGFVVVKQWAAVAAERRALRKLTPSQLDDLGLTAEAVAREAARPFWSSRSR